MNDTTARQIYAKAIGELAISYFEQSGNSTAASLVQSHALIALYDIKNIIDIVERENLDKAGPYERIKAIVEKFFADGSRTPHYY